MTLVDASKLISYGGCGIPYYVSGDVNEHHPAPETSFHMVRDEQFFQDCKDFKVMTETRALSIDRKAKTVLVRAAVRLWFGKLFLNFFSQKQLVGLYHYSVAWEERCSIL